MESTGKSRRHGFESRHLDQREDSSVEEQMISTHQDAGSNPAHAPVRPFKAETISLIS